MRIPRIYTTQPLNKGESLELKSEAARHISRVLRMSAGRELVLFNGLGGEYPAKILLSDKKHVQVKIGDHRAHNQQSPLFIALAIAISRGERMDFICQKATELGVNKITPLSSERSEVKLKGERLEKKLQHWRQITISACEQSGRNLLPEITPLRPLTEWLPEASADCKLVLHHRNQQTLTQMPTPSSSLLLIGPEGGLSAQEIAAAEQQGFLALQLGPRILRTETAPLAAISLLQYLWGDMA